MKIIDFIIGALLVNSMPHLIFGLTKTHFLGLFGYSSKGNIIYALLQLILCCLLFYFNYGINELFTNGYLIGGLTVLILYFIFGKLFIKIWEKHKTANKN